MPSMRAGQRAERATGAVLQLEQRLKAPAGVKTEVSGQSKDQGPGCRRKTGASSQGKKGLLYESSCNGPLAVRYILLSKSQL